jgi:hypothetical protein
MLISIESDISDGGRIYPMGQIYLMKVGYIRPGLVATILKPSRGSDISDSSDMSNLGWINLIWNQ